MPKVKIHEVPHCSHCGGTKGKHIKGCKSDPKNPIRKFTKGKFTIVESGKWKPRRFS